MLANKAYLIEGGVVVTPTKDNGDFTTVKDAADRVYIPLIKNGQFDIRLKHGQSVAFTGMAAGVTYNATEEPTKNYTGSIKLVVDGVDTNVAGTKGEKVSTDIQTLGARTNVAAFTNEFADSPVAPTGLSMNDIPFIVMIVVAVGALVIFVVTKSRKRARDHHDA